MHEKESRDISIECHLERLYTRLDQLDHEYEMVASVHVEHDPQAVEKWQAEVDEIKRRIGELKSERGR